MSNIDPNIDFEQEQIDENKPRMKRNKDGFMRQSNLHYEFDCPECDANNPWEEGFGEESEVRCHYCGQEMRMVTMVGHKIKWKMI